MRFRLCYDGELKASQLDPLTGNPDRLADHKQEIRKQFHPQLKELWTTNRFLRDHRVFPDGQEHIHDSPAAQVARWAPDSSGMVSLLDRTATEHVEYGFRFVPLVKKSWNLRCGLHVLLLRRDPPFTPFHAGDLDNRIKTLIDGLRKPDREMELGKYTKPDADEDPFFCLLQDDKMVTEFSIETETLLVPPQPASPPDKVKDARMVRAIITVDVLPLDVTSFNLSFA